MLDVFGGKPTDGRRHAREHEIARTKHNLRILPRVPGVFRRNDVVRFRFKGVPDDSYCGGTNLNTENLRILNFGRKVEPFFFAGHVFDVATGTLVKNKLAEEELKREEDAALAESALKKKNRALYDFAKSLEKKQKATEQAKARNFAVSSGVFFSTGIVQRVCAAFGTADVAVFGQLFEKGGKRIKDGGKWGPPSVIAVLGENGHQHTGSRCDLPL